ncbi:hypothetical protein SAY86_011921 [Trapa natans]|uniref:Uncharacterized protein n=1 Tax=Trapa natans TaxID=22666 RepID=A0AAN7M961_TRANT|nr:hypothetical protein SAY86_011921 [Trapa natans]
MQGLHPRDLQLVLSAVVLYNLHSTSSPITQQDGYFSVPTLSFRPLILAIVGVLASAFLLVTYYIIITKCCGRFNNTSRPESPRDLNLGSPDGSESEPSHGDGPSDHEPWYDPCSFDITPQHSVIHICIE